MANTTKMQERESIDSEPPPVNYQKDPLDNITMDAISKAKNPTKLLSHLLTRIRPEHQVEISQILLEMAWNFITERELSLLPFRPSSNSRATNSAFSASNTTPRNLNSSWRAKPQTVTRTSDSANDSILTTPQSQTKHRLSSNNMGKDDSSPKTQVSLQHKPEEHLDQQQMATTSNDCNSKSENHDDDVPVESSDFDWTTETEGFDEIPVVALFKKNPKEQPPASNLFNESNGGVEPTLKQLKQLTIGDVAKFKSEDKNSGDLSLLRLTAENTKLPVSSSSSPRSQSANKFLAGNDDLYTPIDTSASPLPEEKPFYSEVHHTFCVFCCTEQHTTVDCPEPPPTKITRIRELKLCRKCLAPKPDHTENTCPEKISCTHCKSEHLFYVFHLPEGWMKNRAVIRKVPLPAQQNELDDFIGGGQEETMIPANTSGVLMSFE